MNDHVLEALEELFVHPSQRMDKPNLADMKVREKAKEAALFLQALIDKGPDEEMVRCKFVELVSPSDCADIGWTDETRDLLNHLVSRLTAIGKGAEADV